MPTNPLHVFIQHLRADLGPDGDGLTDGELLARFLSSRDHDAFAALVRRHARMVWGVCCRLLYNHHDAEDAFQATFLVLVRKAADVPRQAVANWLYSVARRTAVRLRATAAKRRRRETQVVNMPEPTVAEVRDADWQAVLDEELSRLPDKYRAVIVLCDLEDMTRRKAALQIGIPEGSVASRLARARALLAKRLTQRGVVFSGGSVAAALSAGSASASAPPALVASTIEAASLLAAGQAGMISAKVIALTEGVVKAMCLNQLKTALTVILLILGLGMATFGLGVHADAVAQSQKQPVREVPPTPQPTAKEAPRDPEAEARRLENEAETKRRDNDLKGAAEVLRQAVAIRDKLKNEDAAARDREALSHVLTEDNDLKGAAEVLRQAVAIRDKLKNEDAAARDREALSHVLTKDNDLRGAAEVLRQAVALWEVIPDEKKADEARKELSRVLSKSDRKDEAKAVLDLRKRERKLSLDEVWEMLKKTH
jgi:RNA polymerase sigma factor (sigma-70 family)